MDYSECTPKCDGLLVTSYIKDDLIQTPDDFAMKMFLDYDKYKLNVEFPSAIKGKLNSYYQSQKQADSRYSIGYSIFEISILIFKFKIYRVSQKKC